MIKFLADISGIAERQFPMDIYYISERIGSANEDETELGTINVKEINYIGYEKYCATSQISLCFDPLKIIKK